MQAVAYYRVSTQKQGASGLGLDAQREAVRRYVGGGRIVAEFQEVESGGRSKRPALVAALRECRLRGAKLIIAKLDRLSRSVSFLSKLMDEGTDFVAVDMPTANRFMLHVMASGAEHERTLIAERTRAALKAAKERGVALGGLRHDLSRYGERGRTQSARVRAASADRRAREVNSVMDSLRSGGVTSLQALARGLNERNIPAPRGGRWSAGQVRRLVSRVTG